MDKTDHYLTKYLITNWLIIDSKLTKKLTKNMLKKTSVKTLLKKDGVKTLLNE